MSFDILYPKPGDVHQNEANIAVYVDSFAEGLGLSELQVDPQSLRAVASALSGEDFPHVDGVSKASPFKKAANFFVWFVACRPIIDTLPKNIIGEDLAAISNHQNVIAGYRMAVDCLHNAEFQRQDGKNVVLSNRIRVSRHFFRDFVEAFNAAVPEHHFKVVSLLFEQLAYKANPDAPYPEDI